MVHHLVDPRTGLPAGSDLVSVTVVAGETWWAEVLARDYRPWDDERIVIDTALLSVDESVRRILTRVAREP